MFETHAGGWGVLRRTEEREPARPVLWRACAWETGVTCKDSTASLAWKNLALTNPVSTTYLTPGTVTDVSAMFVARITWWNELD